MRRLSGGARAGALQTIVNVSPLKLSFGISLLLHGLIIGAAGLLGQFRHNSMATDEVGGDVTLELIAAPASSSEKPAEPAVPPVQPSPVVMPPTPPPEEIVPVKMPGPAPVQVALLPQAGGKSNESIAEPLPAVAPVATVPVIVATVATSTTVGDSSSPLVGKDFTSATGSSNARAKPDYLKNPEPEYPLAARRRRQQGAVLLNVSVNVSGHVTEISLKQSSGYALLDQAALKAVKTWEFEPARIGNTAMESKVEQPVHFKLRD